MPPPSIRHPRLTACLLAGVAACLLLAARPAQALDYERNDIVVRGLGVGFAVAPIKAPCRTCSAPAVSFIRGVASRQTRFLYFSAETQLGVMFDGGPWLSLGGAVGAETADNAFVKLRGYGEIGTAFTYMNTSIYDYLMFSVEAGLRYQVSDYDRPHSMLYIGARLFTNIQNVSGMVHGGLMWTFD